jgi:hypothetical protein
MLKRGNRLTIWADAIGPIDRADLAVDGLRTILSMLANRVDPEYHVLLLTPDCELDVFIAANARTGPRNSKIAWATARTGAPLRLVESLADYRHAIARIAAEEQAGQQLVTEEELAVM